MQIVITKDEMLDRFGSGILNMGAKGRLVMARALKQGADRVKTMVLRELQETTSVKKWGTVTGAASSYMQSQLSWFMRVRGPGLKGTEFNFAGPRDAKTKMRWSAFEHWKLQDRDERGRFKEIQFDTQPVVMEMWQNKIPIAKSFIAGNRLPLAQRTAGSSKALRLIYGPNLADEVVKGTPAEVFITTVKSKVLDNIEKNVMKFLPS